MLKKHSSFVSLILLHIDSWKECLDNFLVEKYSETEEVPQILV